MFRFIFKKWLNIETRIGIPAGQDKAKTRAREWVAANAKKQEDGQGEDQDEDGESDEEDNDEE